MLSYMRWYSGLTTTQQVLLFNRESTNRPEIQRLGFTGSDLLRQTNKNNEPLCACEYQSLYIGL